MYEIRELPYCANVLNMSKCNELYRGTKVSSLYMGGPLLKEYMSSIIPPADEVIH